MTAIEWLIEQIESCKITMYNDGDRKKLISLVDDDLIQKAKQIEKQQIINAWYNGYENQSPMPDEENCGNTYYEQSYNQVN